MITEGVTLEKRCIPVVSVRSDLHLGRAWNVIRFFIQTNTSAVSVANAVEVAVNWQYTGELIQERNCLNALFATKDLHHPLFLPNTAEVIVERRLRNRTYVMCVARRILYLLVYTLT